MFRSSFIRVLAIGLPLALAACATAPAHINDVCAVFDQRDGWFNSWERAAERTEAKYNIPVSVLMATVRKESGFKGRVRPPRTYLLGFIPWKHKSSAYGYSQALDGTWAEYEVETGNTSARRSNFADAIDFVGWYHNKSAETLGIARNDTSNLYLAYYLGRNAYRRGDRGSASVRRYARDTADMARRYAAQMQECGR